MSPPRGWKVNYNLTVQATVEEKRKSIDEFIYFCCVVFFLARDVEHKYKHKLNTS